MNWVLLVFLLFLPSSGSLPALLSPDSKPKAEEQPSAKRTLLPWNTSLPEAYAQAKLRRQPVLLRVVAEDCPWCRKMEEVIAQAGVQKELGRWTLVSIDVGKSAPDARRFAIGATPALRLLTYTGSLVASRDGYIPADQFLDWLKEHFEKANRAPAKELTEGETLDAAAVARLIGEFDQRDAVAREAAIRRLLDQAAAAGGPVIEAFAEGTLQTRLAALELLREWKAPVQELDPWRPETLTRGRLEALRKWAASAAKVSVAFSETVSPKQLETLRREIARMLQAPDSEAVAMRERLARNGSALLPEVYDQLKQASTDQARERLTALRYRLAASGALALDWPGGLERLAATNASVRQQAAQELAKRATAAEEPLLLELFSNPDPLVREIALRALRDIADPKAREALTRLLRDPEPNVRAAVLKQLAEQPSPAMVPKIVEYVASEKDPDLVVHAIRVLKEVQAKGSIDSLKGLLGHESWRVRAEAAEALGNLVGRYNGLPPEQNADICVALIELLKDDDGFVVSRAIQSLQATDLAVAVEPLVQAARRHPELAAEIVRAMASRSNMRAKAVPHLKRFAADKNPAVRAAAIEGICTAIPGEEAEADLRVALRDPNSTVRRAAAAGIFEILRKQRPDRRGADGREIPDFAERVEEFRAGKGRSKWLERLAELLLPMLTAPAAEERLAAALALIALAQDDKALPVIFQVAKTEPVLLDKCAQPLAWLPWPKRLDLFQQLVAARPQPDQVTQVIHALMEISDSKAIPPLWELAGGDLVKGEAVGALWDAMLELYFHQQRYVRSPESLALSPQERADLIKTAKTKAESGSDVQRLMALALLLTVSLDDAGVSADKIVQDAKASPESRLLAFRVLLLSRPKAESQRLAIAAFTHADPGFRKLAIESLALGPHALLAVEKNGFSFQVNNPELLGTQTYQTNKVIVPQAPKALKREDVRPLLKDPDPQVAACAAYLMVLLGEPEGLEILLRSWRQPAGQKDILEALVYRAIAVLNDDNYVHVLEEIYRRFQPEHYEIVRDFYWTIRGMEGPSAVRLRKTIRQEVGMDHLR